MVYLKGIHLMSDSTEELHNFARKIVVGKSWFHLAPEPHYDLICPHKIDRAVALIEKRAKRKVKIDLEITKEFSIFTSS
jgi:hypothetical protein